MQLLSDYVNAKSKGEIWSFRVFWAVAGGFLSVADTMLPHFLPWVKWGFASSVSLILLSLGKFRDLWMVFFLRWILSGVATGRLISAGGIISFTAGISSTAVMLVLTVSLEKRNLISFYGVSVSGAVVHNVVQLITAGLLLNVSTLNMIKPTILFSIPSGMFVAFISRKVIRQAHLLIG